jgi:Flp pilus assembly pilin Flp
MRKTLPDLRRTRPDTGAAAVEFALLLPIFALLSVGMLSGGLMLWHTISTTQASRDAARLGSTTPIAAVPTPAADGSQGYTIEDWLRRSLYVALQGAGWAPTNEASVLSTNLNRNGERGYACVAYIKGPAGVLTPKHLAVGTPIGAEPAASNPAALPTPVQDGACFSDSATLATPRVQVNVHRRERFNLIISAPSFDVYSRATMPYERDLP